MKNNHKNKQSMEEILENTGKYFNQKLLKNIPDKSLFMKELQEKIQELENSTLNHTYRNDNSYQKPISNFVEQFIYGKNYYRLGLVASLFIVLGGIFIFQLSKREFIDEKDVPAFGGAIQEKDLPLKVKEKIPFGEKEINEQIEKQLFDKIQKEENPQKKEKHIQELIEFYQKTHQEEKIELLLKNFE
jgi:hypothetical protein